MMALRNIGKLTKDELKKFFDSFDTVLSDCDGVLWLSVNLIPGSQHVMNRFKELGKNIFYVTNNSTKTRNEYVEKCNKMGFLATKDEIVSTAWLVACYLKDLKFNRTVYIVGSTGLSQELDEVGISNFGVGPDPLPLDRDVFTLTSELTLDTGVGAVVVGFDEHISYPKLLKAATYLNDPKCLFIATNMDSRFPYSGNKIMPGTGAMVSALTTCAEREPFIVGKPSAYISDAIIKKNNIDPLRTLMIGDRCNTDILFGKRLGLQTLLVLSGVTTLAEVTEWQQSSDPSTLELIPDYYTDKLGDLLDLI